MESFLEALNILTSCFVLYISQLNWEPHRRLKRALHLPVTFTLVTGHFSLVNNWVASSHTEDLDTWKQGNQHCLQSKFSFKLPILHKTLIILLLLMSMANSRWEVTKSLTAEGAGGTVEEEGGSAVGLCTRGFLVGLMVLPPPRSPRTRSSSGPLHLWPRG